MICKFCLSPLIPPHGHGLTPCYACGTPVGSSKPWNLKCALGYIKRLEAMLPFSRLTPAEAERLFYLIEEMGESLQAVGKIGRHGYYNHHPESPISNQTALENELGDVASAINFLCWSGDLSRERIDIARQQKLIRVKKYLHHQDVPEPKEEDRE